MDTLTLHYDIHGLPLRATADRQDLLVPLESMLGALRSGSADGGFEIALRGGAFEQEPGDGLKLFWRGPLTDGPTMSYYTAPGRCAIVLERLGRIDLDLRRRRAQAVVAEGSEALAEHCLYVPMLCEVFSHASHHPLHAAALAYNDGTNAILLAGQSGRGKTTTALALARAGLKLIADDTCFLLSQPQRENLNVWGLKRPCRVRAKTLELLPWLAKLPRKASPDGQVDLIEADALLVAGRKLAEATDILMLDGPNPHEHRIAPAEKIAACEELLRQNVHATDPDGNSSGGSAMRAITKLVAQCRTWRLSVGPDLSTLRDALNVLPGLEKTHARPGR